MCLTYRKALINKKKIPTLEEEKNPVKCDFHEDKKKFDEQTFIFFPYKALCIFCFSFPQ